MKNKVLLSSLLFIAISANGQEIKDAAFAIIEQIGIIHRADSILLENLPSTFDEYVLLWGELDSPLYDYPSVVEHLSHSQQIDYKRFVERVIDISVGASPGVDHINDLQRVSHYLVEYYLRRVVDCLNMKTKQENLQFWSFFFGGIEDISPVIEKDRVIRRTKQMKNKTFVGYIYIETIELGYNAALHYQEPH